MSHIDAYALSAGHPPSASRRVLVDFDKTIRPWGDLVAFVEPLEGAVEAMRSLNRAGFEIIILTSRMSSTWWHDEAGRRGVDVAKFAAEQTAYVLEYLHRFGIPFDEVTAEKMPALAFFDDTAVRVSPEYPLARAVADFLIATATA
jgi:hypothetical protein